ncbi:MAG TPA: tetratricopeptide repeat protein [Sphingomonas sp.]|nr:tetratricopeptide repeat protein [Sphingomonas sp.]
MGSNPTLSANWSECVTEILYRSPALEVRRVAAGDGSRMVVTFDSYHEPGVDRPGFGEAFFRAEGITAVHIMCHDNDWYQYPEIPSLLSVVSQASSAAERVMTYGSSMGGYAALRFAAAVGAHAALALSPQYSIDQKKMPLETRWASDRRRIRFLANIERPIEQVPLMVAAFDSGFEIDAHHVARVAEDAELHQLDLPFAGHPVGPFLNELGLLRPLVLDVLEGRFDQDYFGSTARKHARRSAHWLANVAERHPGAQGERGIAFARRAVSLAPGQPSLHYALARRLAAAGRYREAVEAHERAIAIEPIADYQWGLSKTLFEAGDIAAALAIAQRLQGIAPSTPGFHAWASRLHEALDDLPAALAALRAARQRDPGNPGYRFNVHRLAWRARVRRWRRILFGG